MARLASIPDRRTMVKGTVAWALTASLGGRAWAAGVSGRLAAPLEQLEEEARRLSLVALIVRKGGRDLVSYGEVARVCPVHSMRKSLLSALFGQAVAAGKIDLRETLGALGMNDDPPLTALEKTATVEDLLKARSGVYLPLQPGISPLAARPARGSFEPGTHWCYNNWDFNALGEIFRRKTGRDLFQAIANDIARPIAMQDFDPDRDGRYVYGHDALGSTPRYPNYRLALSARDQARFGELYLNGGRSRGVAVIPGDWVKRSLTAYSQTGQPGSAAGYGYLWWIGTIGVDGRPVTVQSAVGAYGHVTAIMPDHDTVVVIQPDSAGAGKLTSVQTDALLVRVATAVANHSKDGER